MKVNQSNTASLKFMLVNSTCMYQQLHCLPNYRAKITVENVCNNQIKCALAYAAHSKLYLYMPEVTKLHLLT